MSGIRGFVTFFAAASTFRCSRDDFLFCKMSLQSDCRRPMSTPSSFGLSRRSKSIERQLKINRIPETEGLSGLDAVRLWRFTVAAEPVRRSARLLLAYNKEDVVNMKLLLDLALPKLTLNPAGCRQAKPGWAVKLSVGASARRLKSG